MTAHVTRERNAMHAVGFTLSILLVLAVSYGVLYGLIDRRVNSEDDEGTRD